MTCRTSGISNKQLIHLSYIEEQALPKSGSTHIIKRIPINFQSFHGLIPYKNLIKNNKNEGPKEVRYEHQYKFGKNYLNNPMKNRYSGKKMEDMYEYIRLSRAIAMNLPPLAKVANPVTKRRIPQILIHVDNQNISKTLKKLYYILNNLPVVISKNMTAFINQNLLPVDNHDFKEFLPKRRQPTVFQNFFNESQFNNQDDFIHGNTKHTIFQSIAHEKLNVTSHDVRDNSTALQLISKLPQDINKKKNLHFPRQKQVMFLPTLVPFTSGTPNYFTEDEAIISHLKNGDTKLEKTRSVKQSYIGSTSFLTPVNIDAITGANFLLNDSIKTTETPLNIKNIYDSGSTNQYSFQGTTKTYEGSAYISNGSVNSIKYGYDGTNIKKKTAKLQNNIIYSSNLFSFDNNMQSLNKTDESCEKLNGIKGSEKVSSVLSKGKVSERYLEKLATRTVKKNTNINLGHIVPSIKIEDVFQDSKPVVDKKLVLKSLTNDLVEILPDRKKLNDNKTCCSFETLSVNKNASTTSMNLPGYIKNETLVSGMSNALSESTTSLNNLSTNNIDEGKLNISKHISYKKELDSESRKRQHVPTTRLLKIANTRNNSNNVKGKSNSISKFEAPQNLTSHQINPKKENQQKKTISNKLIANVSTKRKKNIDLNNRDSKHNTNLPSSEQSKIKNFIRLSNKSNEIENINITKITKENSNNRHFKRNNIKHEKKKNFTSQSKIEQNNAHEHNFTESSIMKIAKGENLYKQEENLATKTNKYYLSKSKYTGKTNLKETPNEAGQQGSDVKSTDSSIKIYSFATETPILPLEIFFMDINKARNNKLN